MKVLMVGCGAVGQVLGLFLEKSGVDLAFYARPASADRLARALARNGLPLFQVSRARRRDPTAYQLRNYRIVSDTEGSQEFEPDQIWFAVPSPVYYSDWFAAFLRQVPSDLVVCFAPEGSRPEFLPNGVDEDRLVFGGVTFVAWQGDLDGDDGRSEGVSFWLPPMLGIPLMGAAEASTKVAEVLERAGLRSEVRKRSYGKAQASVTALMSTFAAGVELSGWTLKAFRTGPWLMRTARASREGVLSQLPHAGALTRNLLRMALSSPVLWLATFVLPLLFPFDLEQYLKFHYHKTRPQTLALLDLFANDGDRIEAPVTDIRVLRQALLQADTGPEYDA